MLSWQIVGTNASGKQAHIQLSTNPQSSQLNEPLWTDPWLKKTGIGAQELISRLVVNDSSNLSP